MGFAVDIDDRGVRDLAARLNGAAARIAERQAGRTIRAQRDLLRVARSVVHVKSGHLRDSLYIDGASLIGQGTLEGAIRSTAPYADEEAARGGAHDYPAITLEVGADILDQLARDLERIVIEETTGG